MKNAFNAFLKKDITKKEMYRYQELHKKLIGNDMFVEVGESDEWKEFQSLSIKINK